jgi:DNA polymerase-3 subunit gamma/tau
MLIASVSDGALRDALSLMDRCLAISKNIDEDVVRSAAGLAGKDYLFDLAACVINKNTAMALGIIDRLYRDAKDIPKLCDELIAHFRALMMIKTVKNPRDIVVFTDAEFEQSQTQADYLSLAEIVYYMDVLSRAYQRMGKGTGDRTELEMALVKLCSPELDVTGEAFAARLTALERAVKKGISVQTTEALPISEPKDEPPEVIPEKEEKPEPVEQKQEEPAEPEKKEDHPEPKADEKPEAPAPQPAAQPQQGNVDIVKLSREAQPFPQWVEVVDALKSTSRSIAAAFSGSTAYENGSYLLIDSKNTMAFDLLKQGDMRKKVRDILLQITGKPYRLGPYKIETEQEEKQADPLNAFKEKLKDSGVDFTEE